MRRFLSAPKRVEVTNVGTNESVVIQGKCETSRRYLGDGVGTQLTFSSICKSGEEYNGFTFRVLDNDDDTPSWTIDWSRRPIFQIDVTNGSIIRYFSSVSGAGRYGYESGSFGGHCCDADQVRKMISLCLNGHRRSAFGYKWRDVRHDEIVDDEGPVTIVVTPPE